MQDTSPSDSKIISAQSNKTNLYTTITKINIEPTNNSTKTFFLKLAKGDISPSKLEGKFEGVKAIFAVVPTLIPRPIACGVYTSTPSTYFYLAGFVPMTEGVPMPRAFCAVLASLHKGSAPLSPNGKFGFHVTTYSVRTVRGTASFISLSHRTSLERSLPGREVSHLNG